MKKLLLAALAVAAPLTVPVAAQNAPLKENINWPQFMARHDMTWEKLPAKWQDGAFIGNGLLGAMIYLSEDGQNLRWDIGRSDVTDRGGRIPVGTLTLKTVGKLQGGTMRLDLWNAETTGTLQTDKGEIKFRTFTHATDLVSVIELQTTEGERAAKFEFAPGLAVSARKVHRKEEITEADKNPEPIFLGTPDRTRGFQMVKQRLKDGDHDTSRDDQEIAPNHRVVFLSTAFATQATKQATQTSPLCLSGRHVTAAANTRLPKLAETHRAWWHAYWPQSFVSVPDTRIESFYWIQMYKLASATRADRPAIDLMGPWFRSTPWPMIWWNLNIQLTYWPVYASNRLELGQSLTRMIDAGQANLITNVPEKWRDDSAAIGRTSSYDLKGGAGKELGNLTWALHNYWLQYRYSMDEAQLRSLFPILRRAANYMMHNLAPGDDGKLHFPVDISPEYPDAAADTNYNLAILRWALQTLIESDARLKTNDALLPKWKETLEKLAPYPVDEKTGLMIGKNVPLSQSHRHFSHLLMIYPFYTMNWEQMENRALIEKSLNHWISFKGALQGYSYTGAAAMKAQMGRGDDAALLLNQFLDSYVKANTMYLEAGPVIETPLAGAATIHEMLLQSWGGKIRVFPAIPAAWKDVTIHNMRAEGGFLVSASRRNGKLQWVRITSLAGEPCNLQVDFGQRITVVSNRKTKRLMGADGNGPFGIEKGETAVLQPFGDKIDYVVEPVAAQEGRTNYYGSPKLAARPAVLPAADGSLTLGAALAILNGEKIFVQKTGEVDNIGRWIDAADWAAWNVRFVAPGRYKVSARYAATGGGNAYSVTIAGQKLVAQTQATGGWDKSGEFPLGEIEIKALGPVEAAVRAEAPIKSALFNFEAVRLVPVK